ncbi:MAG: hypothetical protein QM754_00420 [Tepidisphaeraceae bacterium]
MPEFSTQPLPPLRTSRDHNGFTRTQLVGDSIGRVSSVDMTFGHISRNVPTDFSPDGLCQIGMGVRVTIPMMTVIVNSFIHRDVFPAVEPGLTVYGHAAERDQLEMQRDSIRLPFREKITYLGRGIGAARNREALQYSNLLEYACEHMNWRPDDFDVYGLRIDYPLLDTMLHLEFNAPAGTVAAGDEKMFGDFI